MICFDLEFFLCEGASGFSGRWLMMGCDDVSGYWDWRLLRLPLSERERERDDTLHLQFALWESGVL